MSADEDTELRDLVVQTLEGNGVLGKIKAQLRASVFLALEEQEPVHNKTPLQNKALQSFLSTKEGKAIGCLVREFLEFFKLDFSLSVFEPEAGVTNDVYCGRQRLGQDLGLSVAESQPLLSGYVKKGSSDRGRTTQGDTEKSFSFASSTEEVKNKKNEQSKPSTEKQGNLTDRSEKDDDSFFDDPLPSLGESKSISSGSGAKSPVSPRRSHIPVKSSDRTREKKDISKQNGPKSGGFLSGAPSLNNNQKKEMDNDFKSIDKNLADLGFDVPDDDYDDDFESSKVSEIGPTPRSARSDHNVKSFDDDIDEVIEEDISAADDFLKSDISGADDLTTDRTVSPTEQSAIFDYAEEVHLP